jgi:hypothetical protein
MSIQAHLKSLEEKRSHIKQQIAEETNHPAPNLMLITALKKQNLAIKEEIHHYLIRLGKEAASSA